MDVVMYGCMMCDVRCCDVLCEVMWMCVDVVFGA